MTASQELQLIEVNRLIDREQAGHAYDVRCACFACQDETADRAERATRSRYEIERHLELFPWDDDY